LSAELLRAAIFHTPRNPFHSTNGLEVFSDGGLATEAGRICGCGEFGELQRRFPAAPVRDLRGGFLLPGFVDTHVHYPQVRVLGALGHELLDWLNQSALPEETRMHDRDHARCVAGEFLRGLASHGTTTALVFGAHFASAMEIFFEAAISSGLRITSGLVVSDRMLLPELHVSPQEAYRQSAELIRRYRGRGVEYAVTPRFALSTSEALLEVCQTLMREYPGVRFQTHINENTREIAEVASLFPWAEDYLAVYEKFDLVSERSVLAHNVHTTDKALARLAARGASVAHCPSSNALLGSGLFPLRRHIAAGVRVALGTDVGGGTGFGMLKEGLQAYLLQRLSPEGLVLTPAQLLYLATRAGAEALGVADETGDFSEGRSADFVYLRPPERSPLEAVTKNAESAQRVLAALFTLAGSESVVETRVRGKQVYRANEIHAQ
jgi:guanine deaminase